MLVPGDSGAGKTSLTARFVNQGFHFLTDGPVASERGWQSRHVDTAGCTKHRSALVDPDEFESGCLFDAQMKHVVRVR